jgi:hypothetical protein
MTSETWAKITARKDHKQKINQCQDQQDKEIFRKQYWEAYRQVKKNVRKDKRLFIHQLTEEDEAAARQCNMKRLYEITRSMSGKITNSQTNH